MIHFKRSLITVALAASALSSGTAFAAPATPACQMATVLVGGQPQKACVTYQGKSLVIMLSGTGQPALNGPPQQVQEPDMTGITDPRIDSYAKRQAIRDQYRGQIDEVTFNDELGDGVALETALADALQAYQHAHS